MTDEIDTGLDALDGGPAPSDASEPAKTGTSADADSHPTVAALVARFPDAVTRHTVSSGQHVVFLEPARAKKILAWLKDDPAQDYAFLTDVTAVDYGGGRPLHMVYQLFSLTHHRTLRVKCELPLDALEIDSVEPLWKTANWLEREVYDLFGITFRGHPDLRRILMPHDYAEGHPLRKDFPLRGRFSRAEQTRRALNQDVERFYIEKEREVGRDPQEVVFPDTPTEAEAGPASGSEG